jgi:multiple sugar transport system ATP-binding protein
VTHDQVEAMTMADKIVVLRAGILEQAGAPLDLYNDPRNLFVAGFIGSPKMNFLPASVENGVLKTAGSSLSLGRDVAGAKTLGIRPEHITITEGSGSKFADVRVDLIENLGGQTVVYATTSDGDAVTVVLEGQRAVEMGSNITLYLDPSKTHVFDDAGNAIRQV